MQLTMRCIRPNSERECHKMHKQIKIVYTYEGKISTVMIGGRTKSRRIQKKQGKWPQRLVPHIIIHFVGFLHQKATYQRFPQYAGNFLKKKDKKLLLTSVLLKMLVTFWRKKKLTKKLLLTSVTSVFSNTLVTF